MLLFAAEGPFLTVGGLFLLRSFPDYSKTGQEHDEDVTLECGLKTTLMDG